MLRPAKPGDAAAIESFLARHAETSMFLRGNLAAYGIDSGSVHPRASTYWLAGDPLRAVFGRSNAGFLMLQAPDLLPGDLAGFSDALLGQRVAGITGATAQVAAVLGALGLREKHFSLHRPEPLYRLALDQLRMPDTRARLRAPRAGDRDLLLSWVWDYDTETLGSPPNDATRARVKATVDSILSGDTTRILVQDGTPVAKTAFNARLPDMVQIGGVYTPPGLRGRGHARAAVALHLEEARAEGVQTAILFASGPAACRAYEAIGFERIGEYTLAILTEPVEIGT